MADNYTYVLNQTRTQELTLNHDYADRNDAFPGFAFADTSVNPVLKNPGLNTNDQDSANFFEIRNAPTSVGSTDEPIISGHTKTRLVNRIIPSANNQTTLANYATNKQETSSYKIRIYDENASTTGQLLAGSTGPGMDLETNDYFVLINPEIRGDDGAVANRPHFAKIKRLTTYDYYGDGFEFEPRYPKPIPKDTNFEIYEGPAKTDTSVVAVSYGLRGKTDTTSGRTFLFNKYDVSSTVSRPTWYFYEDRLQHKDQLDYNTKYQLTTCRWYSDWVQKGRIRSNTTNQVTAYQSTYVVAKHTGSFTDADIGRSLYKGINAGNVQWIGNIASYDSASSTITLDYPRRPLSPSTASLINAADLYFVGRDIQQTIFLTEQEYGVNITDLGPIKHNAVLVDNQRSKDITEVGTDSATDFDTASTYTFTPDRWGYAFRNYSRSTEDKTSAHSDTFATGTYRFNHGSFTGPSRYLYYKSSNLKNNIVDPVLEASVNFPRNKMSQIARAKVFDMSGIQHLKLKEDHSFTVRNTLHSSALNTYKLPFTVTSITGNKIRLNAITELFDARNDNFLKVNDLIRVAKNYYVISAFTAPAVVGGVRVQDITVNKIKTDSEATWNNISSMPSFSNEIAYIRAWNGSLKGTFPIDTEAVYGSNTFQRLTINGNTISKTNASLNDNKLVLLSPEFVNHQIDIDYGDSVHKQIKLSSDFTSKKYYQTTPISMLYYLSGNYAIDEEVFNGSVEDINSQNKNGMVTYEITGRDKLSKLLGNTTNKNLNHTNDIIHSTLSPMLDNTVNVTIDGNLTATGTGTEIRITDAQYALGIIPKPFDVLMDSSGNLLGEISVVGSVAIGSGYRDYTITLRSPNISETQVNSGATVKLYRRDTGTYITGIKALSANPTLTTSPTDFTSTGDKGVVFVDGEKVKFNDSGTGPITTNITYADLAYASASGSYNTDNSLGFDIIDTNSIGAKDSKFAFKIGLESEVSTTLSSIHSLSTSTYFNVLDSVSQDGLTTITLAPTFPIVLGSIENNSSDSTFTSANSNLYLVNRNIPKSGFIHTLKSDNTSEYVSSKAFKYNPIQRVNPGELKETFTSVLNDSPRNQKIMGYASAYRINADGSINSTDYVTTSNKPILGSNFHDDNYTGSDKLTLLPKQFPATRTGTSVATTSIRDVEQKDFRTKKYELLSVGDLYPESKLRYNSLFQSSAFTNYGLLTEKIGQKDTSSIGHVNYTGGSFQSLASESNYNIHKINSSSTTPTNIKRFGVMRLVEATFDWHFTPIDAESLQDIDTVPKISNFSYPRWKTPESLGFTMATSNTGNASTNQINCSGSTVRNFKEGDMFFKTSDGSLVARINGTGYATISTNGSGIIQGSQVTVFQDTTSTSVFKANVRVFDMLTDDGFGLDTLSNANDMRHLAVYLTYGHINKNAYFEHVDKLHSGVVNNASANPFIPNNIFLPIIPEGFNKGGSGSGDNDDFRFTPYHSEGDWALDFDGDTTTSQDEQDYAIKYWHYSRIINALQMQTFTTYDNDGDTSDDYPSPDQYKAARSTHLYENCIGVFKHFRGAIKESQGSNQRDIITTSSLLELDTQTNYNNYEENVGTSSDRQQHSRNMRIDRLGSPNVAYIGTKTKQAPFISEDDAVLQVGQSHHNDASSTTGELYQTQMIIKPTIRTDGMSGNTITITMNASNTHNWIHYAPNLTGYYLVRLGDGKDTLKIISHTVNDSSTHAVHTLTLNANLTASQRYRLMRVSETTFDETPGFIEFNKEIHTGLQYNDTATRLDTGEPATMGATTSNFTGEGIVSMYVLLDVDDDLDSDNKMIENIDLVNQSLELFDNGEVIDCCITDGHTTTRKNITVTKDITTGRQSLRFDYEGTLSGNGVVSFGKAFTITTNTPLQNNVERAYIGTTMAIGLDAETAINEILNENDIEVDDSERNLTFTGAIVSSVSGNNILLQTEVATDVIANGDTLYNQDGKLIGLVASGQGTTTLTLDDVDYDSDSTVDTFYVPQQYEELVKYTRRPFIINTRFAENDVFTAVNFLASKKGLEYVFKGEKIQIRDIDDYSSRRIFSLRYRDGQNLISAENNTSLFDRANKVVVIGDNVKATTEMPTDKNTRTLTHIDSNIKYSKEAQVKAEQLLALHNAKTTKVTIEIERKDEMKLMKPGDLITLNFPNHNIPPDDYIVYEIENAMSAISKITVGTFNKTIAERLAEMNIERKGGFSTLLTKDVTAEVTSKSLFEEVGIDEVSLISQRAIPTGTTLGWATLIGWSTPMNAGSDVVTTEEIEL